MKTSYNKELGLLFDACQIITCKTAPMPTWITDYVHTGTELEDLQFIEDILSAMSSVSPKLILLGYIDKKKGSLINRLLTAFVNEYTGSWSSKQFIHYVTNEDRIKREIAQFYFNTDSTDSALDAVAESSYSADIKACLYEFFLYPQKYITLMNNEIQSIITETEKYYFQHAHILLDCVNSFDSDILLSLIPKKLKSMDRTYSFSIISRYAVFYGVEKTHNWVIVGSEYKKLTDVTNQAPIDLAAFSNAFGDKIRVKIVDLIRENGEMTLADLSKNLGVVNTIAIYHLDILKKENLMLQRHNGRKVLYSLNIAQITRGLTLLEELCGMTSKENN